MKFSFYTFILLLLPFLAQAQVYQYRVDSLLFALEHAPNDTVRLELNRNLGFMYQESEPIIALPYHEQQLKLARKLSFKLWEADAHQQMAYCQRHLGSLSDAFENYNKALELMQHPKLVLNGWGYDRFSNSKTIEDARMSIVGMTYYELAGFYSTVRHDEKGLIEIRKALKIGDQLQNKKILSLSNRVLGLYHYQVQNDPDSALYYLYKSLRYYRNSPYQLSKGIVSGQIGSIYENSNQFDSARVHYYHALNSMKNQETFSRPRAYILMGAFLLKMGQKDSALVYAKNAQNFAESLNYQTGKAAAYTLLSQVYKSRNEISKSLTFLEKGKAISDSLNNAYTTRLMQFQNLAFEKQTQLKDLEKRQEETRIRNRMYALMAGMITILLIVFLLIRANRQKQEANMVLKKTLTDLKSTQAQLIHAEKMASLGELTAGIAHEIQNPLNFVNNFSEVNGELIDEQLEEIEKGDYEEVKELALIMKENSSKINHHGKRADAIVKGMLAHSRTGKGEKELTDINQLADEYLRLSYHGLRAKDPSFNAEFKTDFDPNLPKVNVIPQDIGRVLLNLINNAFQACAESDQRTSTERSRSATGLVTITTKLIRHGGQVANSGHPELVEGQLLIAITDNGPGIPDNIKDKIFQPFFTTKPTGQGTGLGLSLSYDIVKAHGGSITVESKKQQGTTFKVVLHV